MSFLFVGLFCFEEWPQTEPQQSCELEGPPPDGRSLKKLRTESPADFSSKLSSGRPAVTVEKHLGVFLASIRNPSPGSPAPAPPATAQPRTGAGSPPVSPMLLSGMRREPQLGSVCHRLCDEVIARLVGRRAFSQNSTQSGLRRGQELKLALQACRARLSTASTPPSAQKAARGQHANIRAECTLIGFYALACLGDEFMDTRNAVWVKGRSRPLFFLRK